MLRLIITRAINGILFGIMDALLHANPFAQRLLSVYKPIARTSVNAAAGIVIDLSYGFILGLLFLLLYKSLPGETGIVKGLSFAMIVWFLRVLMSVLSSWMMYTVPVSALVYVAAAGLVEMAVLGAIYGIFLHPFGN
ncbi:MAG: hypothetical protein JW863_08610 [Chitinispirillaceae bacterium]|nr:hypothetical protein [Chitinispirillaceae bacterium]